MADSDTSGCLVDDARVLLWHSTRGYKELKEPKRIVTTANEKVLGKITGAIGSYIIDRAGQRIPVRISTVVVPGLGRNILSSAKAMKSGVSTMLEAGNPHVKFNRCTSLPLHQHPAGKGMRSFELVFLPWVARLRRDQQRPNSTGHLGGKDERLRQ